MSSSRLIFVTYADGVYEQNLKPNAWFARHLMGADKTVLLTRKDLEASPVYAPNRQVFDAPRGRGYWAWKPWAILQALDASEPGDVVVYQDCGFGLRYRTFLRPRALMALARTRGFLAGVRRPDHGPNSRWVHQRCLTQLGQAIPAYLAAPMVEATISMWVVSDDSRRFLRTWLDRCLEWNLVRDIRADEKDDQLPDFIEHRHDQAILTMLAIRSNAPVIEPSTDVLSFAKSLSILELDQRARTSRLVRMVLGLLTAFAGLRRGLNRDSTG